MSELKKFWNNNVPMTFYEENRTYADKRNFRYALQSYMMDVFNFDCFNGKKVLDLGCGAGIDSVEFASHGAIVTCVDFSKRAVTSTKALFKNAGLKSEIILADAKDLGKIFPSNYFDCVYSFGVLHHIPDIDRVLTGIVKVLKTHGLFMGMVYNADSLMHAMLLLRAYFLHSHGKYRELPLELLSEKLTERIFGVPYSHLYTRTEAMDLFSKYLSNVTVDIYYDVIDVDKQRKIFFSLNSPHLNLGWHLIIKGEKQ